MKKYVSFLFLVLLLVVGTVLSIDTLKASKVSKIDKILASDNYSYLPVEAKDYIKEVYEETGEIILTEKNKEENEPYLNPKYVAYLSLSEEEKLDVELLPDIYVIDFSTSDVVEDNNYPSKFNLNNIDNRSYLTPFKHQGSLGICWAFASIEQAESYLMLKDNKSYTSSSETFSARQMDYATSNDGIKNYVNDFSNRGLTTGGNFYTSSLIMSYGLSLVDDSLMPFNESTDKKELFEVLNYANSKYELDSSIKVLPISSSTTSVERENYNNFVKENIMKYGGAYVGTGSPTGNCGFKNIDGTYAMTDDGNCSSGNGHAMQIIGWDDEYQYSYCKSGMYHYSLNSSGGCTTGSLVTGKGAWILRNSWGASSAYRYVYLTYNSNDLDINFSTSLSPMKDRSWDNSYYKNMWSNGYTFYYSTMDTVSYTRKIDTKEKVEKIKFNTFGLNGEYVLSIKVGDTNYSNIKAFKVDNVGLYTIDLSDSNIILDQEKFEVTIRSKNGVKFIKNTISVFTSNLESTPAITADDIETVIEGNKNLTVTVPTFTKNISSGETISYSLYRNNVDYSNYIISIANNKVAANNANTTLVLNSTLPAGTYKLIASYKNYSSVSNIVILSNIFEGKGTEESPYLIYKEEDLEQMKYNLDAYYLLKKDITLTKNWTPIGTEKEPFRGGFDGGNHTISNLKIDSKEDSAAGFFGYVEVKTPYSSQILGDYREKTYIKNVKFKEASVSNSGDASILVGKLIFNANKVPEYYLNVYSPTFTIDSVYFIDGSVISLNGNSGVITGNVNIIPRTSTTPYFTINNVYSSATMTGYQSTGLIGFINDSFISGTRINLTLNMTNIQNVGVIDETMFNMKYPYQGETDKHFSPVIGYIYGNARITMNNYIITSIFKDRDYMYAFSGNKFKYIGAWDEADVYQYDFSKGYYISKYYTITDDLKDKNTYNSWTDFDKYWNLETIGDITRLPVLKEIDYFYTLMDTSEITLDRYDEVVLTNYFEGKKDFSYITVKEVSNDNVIDLEYIFEDDDKYADNIKIVARNKGTAVIRIINNYDGFEKDVTITVNAEKKQKPTITYFINSEDDEKEIYIQQLTKDESFTLEKNRFVRRGYEFINWNTMPNGKGTSYGEEELIENGIDEDFNLYAQWKQKTYTIKFDANGGVGSMYDRLGYIDHNILLSNNNFTREGYNFISWNTKADGTGVSFDNRATVTIDETVFGDDDTITLYAQWERKTYTIRFDANGGVGAIDNQNVFYSIETALSKNVFTRNGYKFINWNTASDGSGISLGDETTIKMDENLFGNNNMITLYAQWENKIPYIIENYNHDEEKQYISNITIGTDIEDFKKNIKVSEGYNVEIDVNVVDGKEMIFTGGKTRILKGEELLEELTNVVSGDINGDGMINSADLLRVRQHLLGTNILKEVYFESADINHDQTINSSDLLRVRQHLLGIKNVS